MFTTPPTPTASPTDIGEAVDLLSGPPTEVSRDLAITRLGQAPGSAPTLLLIHGVGAARVVWAPVLPELARHYDVLVVDLPGHGASAPLDGADPSCLAVGRRVAASCAELGVVRPHLVGNSLGGWIGLEMAADDAAASLVALAPAGLRIRPVKPSPVLLANRALAQRTERIADALLDNTLMRRLVFATGSSNPTAVHPGVARGMVRALARCTAYEVMLDAASRRRFERKAQVHVPTVVVFGDRDLILPPANQRPELAPAHAEWQRWERCGHAPMWDHPHRTVELIHHTVDAALRRADAAAQASEPDGEG
ncbi:MAG: alpha/beta fold hydrolase [Kineosporiaceae bacterium]